MGKKAERRDVIISNNAKHLLSVAHFISKYSAENCLDASLISHCRELAKSAVYTISKEQKAFFCKKCSTSFFNVDSIDNSDFCKLERDKVTLTCPRCQFYRTFKKDQFIRYLTVFHSAHRAAEPTNQPK